jgi:DAK2 domain fusion protein YloV
VVCAALRRALEHLGQRAGAIDRLNVFPVPDGDTGQNMYRTLAAAVKGAEEGADDLARAIGRSALLGARGNSGVILSQIVSALVVELLSEGPLEEGWCRGLARASEAARAAVLNPMPGTILSVLAAGAGVERCDAETTLRAMREALERTPLQLEVLARAGVVDSGGAGLVVIMDALGEALGLTGPSPESYPWLARAADLAEAVLTDGSACGGEGAPEQLRFEVMFSLEAAEPQVQAMKTVWAGLGDSIVVVGGDGLYRAHIHTNEIGPAIEAGIEAGRVADLSVTDLEAQIDEVGWVADELREAPAEAVSSRVVAVAVGRGVARLFRSFGVSSLVAGGQGRNPSIGELRDAILATSADEVLVLPNNANVQAAAQSVAALVDKRVAVIPTVNVLEGFAALIAYDPESSLDENIARMTDAARQMVVGEVTRAMRAGTARTGSFEAGWFIGLGPGGILTASTVLAEAVLGLASELVGPDAEILTLLVGEDADPETTRQVEEELQVRWPELTIEVLDGGQPLYPYLLGVE